MELRWLTTYDEFGVNEVPYLQFRESENEPWRDVEHIRMSEKQYEEEEITWQKE